MILSTTTTTLYLLWPSLITRYSGEFSLRAGFPQLDSQGNADIGASWRRSRPHFLTELKSVAATIPQFHRAAKIAIGLVYEQVCSANVRRVSDGLGLVSQP